MHLTRRRFLHTASLAAAAGLAPAPLEMLLARIAHGATQLAPGFGAPQPDPERLLDLPAGFQYRALSTGVLASDMADDSRFASTLTNGDPVPANHDGMAAFAGPPGITVLVRNHELDPGDRPMVDPARARPYDPQAPGGTTTLWVDARRELVRSFASLSGTLRNCAGGSTPWGTWLSAEEDTRQPGDRHPLHADLTPEVGMRHGYVFEVDARALEPVAPVPIVAMGRFRHEAVAVDPATAIAYLTEDRPDGLFYRYVPDVVSGGRRRPNQLRPGDYARGGRLEALRVTARPGLQTQNHGAAPALAIGERVAVDWVPIPDVDPAHDEERDPTSGEPDPFRRPIRAAATSTRAQGFARGAAQFARSEGIALRGRHVHFCATDGGNSKLGQVFRLDLARQELALVVESTDDSVLDGPDNLCIAPWNDLIVCEDGSRGSPNRVVGITPAGRTYTIARVAHRLGRELAGACFAPDGRTMFVNLQQPGVTFAIWGPWNSRRA